MTPIDDQLNRLFRGARMPAALVGSSAPFGLETRVLAAWRGIGVDPIWSTTILVRGLLLASLIMVVSLWPAWNQNTNFDSASLQFADSSVQTDYP